MKNIFLLLLISILFTNSIPVNAKTLAPPTPLETVKTFLMAYQQKDHQLFVSVIDDNIFWLQPGNNRISGELKSKEALLKFGANMSRLTAKSLRLADVQYFEGTGNTVSCLLHWQGATPDGKLLDIHNIDVYKVENGKITEAIIYSENLALENEFWGK